MYLKTFIRNMSVTLFFLPMLSLSLSAAENPEPVVVPAVQQWQGSEGYFSAQGGVICIESQYYADLSGTAQLFQQDLETICGVKCPIVMRQRISGRTAFFFTLDSDGQEIQPEGYVIEIGDNVVVRAKTAAGIFYASRTLLQILMQNPQDKSIPKGEIVDYPRFRKRMLMLDVGRKFFPYEVLQDYIRYMGWFKMNELQLHLSDNAFGDFGYAGFRLECETFGALTSKDGFYTKKQIRTLQDMAKLYGITITPEIDSPGHALCFTNLRPDLRHPKLGKPYLDVTNPETYKLMEKIFDEFVPLFDAPDFHIGTDEYRLGRCTQEEKEQLGEGFRKYINHFNKYIRKKGKNVRIWSGYEHMPGTSEIDKDVIIDMWVSNDAKNKSAAGYKFINSNHGWTYIVPGAPYYGVINSFIYNNWYPNIFSNKAENNVEPDDENLLGGKLHVWNDLGPTGYTMTEIADLATPSIIAFAEKLWGKKGSENYQDFVKRVEKVNDVPGVSFLERIPAKDKNGLVYDSGAKEITFASGNDFVKLPWAGERENLEFPWTVSLKVLRAKATGQNEVLLSSGLSELYLDMTYKTKDKQKKDVVLRGVGFERANYYVPEPLRAFAGHRIVNVFDYQAPQGKWVSLTFVGNRKNTALYVDGELIGTSKFQMLCPLARLGSERSDSLVGKMKDVKIYNRALRKSEIARLAGLDIPENLAWGKKVTASASHAQYGLVAELVVDEESNTRWSSGPSRAKQWLMIDLEKETEFNGMTINWETAYPNKYRIEISDDNQNWKTIFSGQGKKGIDKIDFDQVHGRYVRIVMSEPATQWGFSIWEVEVFKRQQ